MLFDRVAVRRVYDFRGGSDIRSDKAVLERMEERLGREVDGVAGSGYEEHRTDDLLFHRRRGRSAQSISKQQRFTGQARIQ